MQLLKTTPFLLAPLLATIAAADCSGPISYTTCADRITHYFDPETGEVCDPLDCGGGRAPVKYDVPGCAAYTGTEIYTSSKSILSCWSPSTVEATVTTTTTVEGSETATETTTVTTSDGVRDEKPTLPTSAVAVGSASVSPLTTPAPTSTPAGSNSTGNGTQTETADEPIDTNAADLQVAAGTGSLVAAVAAIMGLAQFI